MEYRQFGATYLVRIDRGEEVVSSLTALCQRENIRLAAISAIGACDRAVVGVYDMQTQVYHRQTLSGFMEITSLTGTVTEKDGAPYLHLHGTFCDESCAAHGGHVTEIHIAATCEVTLTCIDGHVGREHQASTGLNLFRFD